MVASFGPKSDWKQSVSENEASGNFFCPVEDEFELETCANTRTCLASEVPESDLGKSLADSVYPVPDFSITYPLSCFAGRKKNLVCIAN